MNASTVHAIIGMRDECSNPNCLQRIESRAVRYHVMCDNQVDYIVLCHNCRWAHPLLGIQENPATDGITIGKND